MCNVLRIEWKTRPSLRGQHIAASVVDMMNSAADVIAHHRDHMLRLQPVVLKTVFPLTVVSTESNIG